MEKRAEVSEKIQKSLIKKAQNNNSSYLYDQIYLPVDSVFVLTNNHSTMNFTLRKLVQLGLEGWEVISTIPRTKSEGLANDKVAFSEDNIDHQVTWGGGSGGNIIGVYLLLKAPLHLVADNEQMLESYVNRNIDILADTEDAALLKESKKAAE